MTHSLHRHGSIESLKDDFVFITRTIAGVNREGCGPKMHAIRNILCDVGVTNAGKMEIGENMAHALTEKMFRADESASAIISASVSGRDRIKEIIRRVKEGNFGLSITLSGLIDDIVEICRELDIKPHTVNLSLGIHGRTDALPSENCLELTTMCGHALIATHLVEQGIDDVSSGRLAAKDAARMLARPCVCGIFNMVRAEKMLQGGRAPKNKN